jgi:hypothetical protein
MNYPRPFSESQLQKNELTRLISPDHVAFSSLLLIQAERFIILNHNPLKFNFLKDNNNSVT